MNTTIFNFPKIKSILVTLLLFIFFQLGISQVPIFKKIEKGIQEEVGLKLAYKDASEYNGNKTMVFVFGKIEKVKAIISVVHCKDIEAAKTRLALTEGVRPKKYDRLDEYFDNSFTYFEDDGTYTLLGRKGKIYFDISTQTEAKGIKVVKVFEKILN